MTAKRKDLFIFLAFVAGSLLLSLVFIIIYQRQFDFRAFLIFRHMLLALSFHSGIFLLILGISRIPRLKKMSIIYGLVYGLFLYCLTLVYMLAYFGQSFWGTPVTLKLMWNYIPQIDSLIAALPLDKTPIYTLLALHLLLIIGIPTLLGARIKKGILYISDSMLAAGFFRWTSWTSKLAAGLLVFIFSLIFWKGIEFKRFVHKADDPVMNTLFGLMKTQFLFEDSRRVNEAIKDRELKENYPVFSEKKFPNVILIVVDALRADFLPAYGYPEGVTPFLSQMERDGEMAKVERMLATCPESYCGILSILCSREWQEIGLENFSIHDVLKKQGFNINFILSGGHSNWYNLHKAYGKSIDFFYEGFASKKYSANDDRVILEGLDSVKLFDGTPAFFNLHLMSSHWIGLKQPEYMPFQPAKADLEPDKIFKGEYDRDIMVNNYKNGIFQADAIIKSIFQKLSDKGYLENSVIFILGDHGEAFGEHGHFGHGFELYQEDISIPLLIFDDSLHLYNSIPYATQLDVGPTLLDRLNLPIPESWQGRSIIQDAKPMIRFHQSTLGRKKTYGFTIWEQGKYQKFIFREKTGEYFFFDLENDPVEKDNLFPSLPETRQEEFKKMLEVHFGI